MSTMKRLIFRTCSDCGRSFAISVKLQEIVEENGLKLPKRCKVCRKLRKSGAETCTCLACGELFQLTVNEAKFYAERGLSKPRRCEECRMAKNGKTEE